MNTLYNDLLLLILYKIPKRNLPILKFVCKKWNVLFNDKKITISTCYHCYKYDYINLINWLQRNQLFDIKNRKIYQFQQIIKNKDLIEVDDHDDILYFIKYHNIFSFNIFKKLSTFHKSKLSRWIAIKENMILLKEIIDKDSIFIIIQQAFIYGKTKILDYYKDNGTIKEINEFINYSMSSYKSCEWVNKNYDQKITKESIKKFINENSTIYQYLYYKDDTTRRTILKSIKKSLNITAYSDCIRYVIYKMPINELKEAWQEKYETFLKRPNVLHIILLQKRIDLLEEIIRVSNNKITIDIVKNLKMLKWIIKNNNTDYNLIELEKYIKTDYVSLKNSWKHKKMLLWIRKAISLEIIKPVKTKEELEARLKLIKTIYI